MVLQKKRKGQTCPGPGSLSSSKSACLRFSRNKMGGGQGWCSLDRAGMERRTSNISLVPWVPSTPGSPEAVAGGQPSWKQLRQAPTCLG